MTRLWGLRTRAIALLLLCTAALSLGASADRASNSIGQDLGPWQGGRYRLHLQEGGGRTLHDEGEILFIETRRHGSDWYTIERRDKSGEVSVTLFKGERPVERSEGDRRTLYQYDEDGRLELVTLLIDGVVDRVEVYSYHRGDDASLIAVVALGSAQALRTRSHDGDNRVYAYYIEGSGESFTDTRAGLEVIQGWGEGVETTPSVLQSDDDGGFTLTRGTRIDRYDRTGRLAERIDGGEVTNYRYNEDNELMVTVRQTTQGRETTTYYEKEQAVRSEDRWAGELIKSTRYLDTGGRMETLYVNGSPYSDVTYGPETGRVLSIVYH